MVTNAERILDRGNFGWGRPVNDLHACIYGELTASRERGEGAGMPPASHFPSSFPGRQAHQPRRGIYSSLSNGGFLAVELQ